MITKKETDKISLFPAGRGPRYQYLKKAVEVPEEVKEKAQEATKVNTKFVKKKGDERKN